MTIITQWPASIFWVSFKNLWYLTNFPKSYFKLKFSLCFLCLPQTNFSDMRAPRSSREADQAYLMCLNRTESIVKLEMMFNFLWIYLCKRINIINIYSKIEWDSKSSNVFWYIWSVIIIIVMSSCCMLQQ